MKMKKLFLVVLIGVCLSAFILVACPTPDFAKKTKKDLAIEVMLKRKVNLAYEYCKIQVAQAVKKLNPNLSKKAKHVKLRALMDIKKIAEYLGNIKVGRSGAIFVLDSQGMLLFHTAVTFHDWPIFSTFKGKWKCLYEHIYKPKSGYTYFYFGVPTDRDFKKYTFYLRYIHSLDWILVAVNLSMRFLE